MDILCVLHDGDEYGLVRWPLADLARAAGVALKLAQELVSKLVLKGADSGPVKFAHTPRHAGKDGEPVVLVDGQGPIWFSSRMVTDEWRRKVSGGKTRFGDTKLPTKIITTPRLGDDQGDGATASSSTFPSVVEDTNMLKVVLFDTVAAPAKAVAVRKPQKSAEPDGFDEFYRVYPRHIARGKAAAAYRKALAKASPDIILEGATRFATARAGEDHEFTPYPATWLNAGQWADEIEHHGGSDNGRRKLGSASNSRHLQGLGLGLAALEDPGPGEEPGGGIIDCGNVYPLLQR